MRTVFKWYILVEASSSENDEVFAKTELEKIKNFEYF